MLKPFFSSSLFLSSSLFFRSYFTNQKFRQILKTIRSNTGFRLHIIELRDLIWTINSRAGLDYHEFTAVTRHHDYRAFLKKTLSVWFASIRKEYRSQRRLSDGDCLMFGLEDSPLKEHSDARPLKSKLHDEWIRSMN